MRLLLLGQAVNVLTGSVGFLLAMTGRERQLRNAVLISGPCSILLAILLIPIYGIEGAAVSTAIGLALQNILCFRFVYKSLHINVLRI